jgi:hypothetical protein
MAYMFSMNLMMVMIQGTRSDYPDHCQRNTSSHITHHLHIAMMSLFTSNNPMGALAFGEIVITFVGHLHFHLLLLAN